jgi:predicted nucleic acid-binding protein
MRRGSLSFDQATSLQREAEDLLRECEFEVDSNEVLQLVRDSDCTAYDCEFVAVAAKLDVKLVTMDKKLLRAFPDHCASLSAG